MTAHVELKTKILGLLDLLGTRDFDFLCLALSDAARGDVAISLVELALEEKISLSKSGISSMSEDRSSEQEYPPEADGPDGYLPEEDVSKLVSSLETSPNNRSFTIDANEPLRPAALPTEDRHEGQTDDLRSVPVAALDLREAVIRRLQMNRICTVGDILDAGEDGLLALRRVGVGLVSNVRFALELLYRKHGAEMPEFRASAEFAGDGGLADGLDGTDPRLPDEPVSLDEWISSLPPREAELLDERLEGATLQEVGDGHGLTRERVRQICARALDRRPAIEEDRYLPLFEKYAFDEEAFDDATLQSHRVFNYLSIVATSKKGDRLPLESAMNDPELSEDFKSRLLESGALSSLTDFYGEAIPARKSEIISRLVLKHAKEEPISLEELLSLYENFLAERGIPSEGTLASYGIRALGAYIDRMDTVINAHVPIDENGLRKGIRYFDFREKDLAPLVSLMQSLSSRNIEVSARYIFELPEAQDALRKLDIRNEYELHAVLQLHCPDIPGVKLGRVPMVTLGAGDRHAQVVDLIEELSPVSTDRLSSEYERRYGVRSDTFAGTFLKDFDRYYHDGRYSISRASITDDQRAYLASLFDGVPDYVETDAVVGRFLARYPDWQGDLLSPENLRGTGYSLSRNLLMRDGVDFHETFSRLIASHDRFVLGKGEFSPTVSDNEVFLSELNKAKRAWKVIEVLDRHFLSIREFERAVPPLGANDFEAFLGSVVESVEASVPFNCRSLRKMGLTAHLDATARSMDLGDSFIDSVLEMGYVGGRIKRTSINGKPVHCITAGQFSADDLLRYLTLPDGSLPVSDAVRILDERYGISILPAQVRAIAKRGGMVVDPTKDMILAGGFGEGELDGE